jgi:hypothetical protein
VLQRSPPTSSPHRPLPQVHAGAEVARTLATESRRVGASSAWISLSSRPEGPRGMMSKPRPKAGGSRSRQATDDGQGFIGWTVTVVVVVIAALIAAVMWVARRVWAWRTERLSRMPADQRALYKKREAVAVACAAVLSVGAIAALASGSGSSDSPAKPQETLQSASVSNVSSEHQLPTPEDLEDNRLIGAPATTTLTTSAPQPPTTATPTTAPPAPPAPPPTTATATTAQPTPPPTTAATTEPQQPPTTAPQPTSAVHPGSFCAPAGATGLSAGGVPMTCSTGSCEGKPYDQPRWRKSTC